MWFWWLGAHTYVSKVILMTWHIFGLDYLQKSRSPRTEYFITPTSMYPLKKIFQCHFRHKTILFHSTQPIMLHHVIELCAFQRQCVKMTKIIRNEGVASSSKNSSLLKSWFHKSCRASNSSGPIDVCIRQYTRPPLVRIMVCHLFGAKPSSKLMLTYCLLNNC